jgi:ATP-dependent helicase/nuclease subunit A
VFDNYLNNIDRNNPDDVYKDILFSEYERSALEKKMNTLLKRRDIFDNIAKIYDNDYADYEKLILKEYYNLTKDFTNNFVENLINGYGELSSLKYNDKDNKSKIIFLMDKIIETYHNEENNYCDLTKNILELSSLKYNNKNYVVNKIEKKLNETIQKKLIDISDRSSLQLHFNLAKELINICKDIIDVINAEKKILNGIDFDDILILTRKLLVENPEIAQCISSEYKEIMVDEFQDTNIIQYDIIKALVPSLVEANKNKTTNIFIVGDAKQSIYRFRNADVSIFNDAIKNIGISNQKNKRAANLQNGNLELTATFRTLPVITGFVNKVCGKLFDDVAEKSHIKYSDLICGRD